MRLGLCCVEEHFQVLWNILEEMALGTELPYLILAQKLFIIWGNFGKILFFFPSKSAIWPAAECKEKSWGLD